MPTDPRSRSAITGLDPSEGLTLAAYIGNGLDEALRQRLLPPGPYAYLDIVEWTYAPADHAGALFGDIGTLTGRRCRVALSLARTTRTLAVVALDVRTLTGFTRPVSTGPLTITLRGDRIVSAAFPAFARLPCPADQSLPVFDGLAEFLLGHLDRTLCPRPLRARANRASRPS